MPRTHPKHVRSTFQHAPPCGRFDYESPDGSWIGECYASGWESWTILPDKGTGSDVPAPAGSLRRAAERLDRAHRLEPRR